MLLEDPDPGHDDAIRATVARLARPHPAGKVIERAAIMAEGSASSEIVAWIIAHAGQPESAQPAASTGLHGSRSTTSAAPARYVLPPGALAAPAITD